MSVKAIGWALEVRTGKATSKVVLIALANYADAAGVCWPSQALIAFQTEMSIDSVQRRLRDLEADGLIKRERRNGRRGERRTDRYVLQMHSEPQFAALETLSRRAPEPKPQLCGSHVDEPSKEPKKRERTEPSVRPRGRRLGNGIGKRSRDQSHPSQGAVELELAKRLGPDGWAILLSLPQSEVEHLCIRHRRGHLDEATLDRLREGADS